MLELQNRSQFLNLAGIFEGGLALLALGLAWLIDLDPLALLHFDWIATAWGVGAGLLLFAVAMVGDRVTVPGFSRIKQLLIEFLGRPLSLCRWYDLILLAVLAGFSEELLFRGVLQPWAERHLGYAGGLFVSNVAFGLAHAVTPMYALLAGAVGAYLGWLMDATGERNLLPPMITHALYDYLAFLWILREYRHQAKNMNK